MYCEMQTGIVFIERDDPSVDESGNDFIAIVIEYGGTTHYTYRHVVVPIVHFVSQCRVFFSVRADSRRLFVKFSTLE